VRKRTAAVVAASVLLLAAGAAAAHWALRAPPVPTGLVYVGKEPTRQALHLGSSAWCGTDAASADREPDAAAGRQVHVVYAVPADGQERFASFASAIATDVGAIDSWWRTQDPTRTPRFDLYAFPGCPSGIGQLDISDVQLSQPSAYYAPVDNRAERLIAELGDSFADPFKKYLVYYDGAVDEPRLCGESLMGPNEGGRFAYSLVYDQACHPDVGAGAGTAHVAAHELAHNFGAVPPGGPPHACPGNPSHVCDDENDLLYPYTRGQPLSAITLDSGRDDYYAHSGTWWDVQDSAWLSHLDAPRERLAVTVAGSGSGTVASDLPGIACPPSCSIDWDQGSTLVLTATAGDGTRFIGWSGACTTDPCTPTMTTSQTVIARFAAQVQVRIVVRRTGSATGTVTSRPARISCQATCTESVDQGARVQLAAVPGKSSAFAGWSGACAGRAACVLTAGTASAVTATLAPAQRFTPPKPKCKPGQRPTRARPCRR
jgi:List-Bact-rpt repeat protein